MSAAQLKPLLAKGNLTSDKLTQAASTCTDWYTAEPSLATFVLRGIFKDMIARGWDDAQGVPTAHYQPFEDGVLPILRRVVDTLVATPAAEPIDDLDALVIAYRDSVRAIP